MLSLITISKTPYLKWTLIRFGYATPDILRVHGLLHTTWKVQHLPEGENSQKWVIFKYRNCVVVAGGWGGEMERLENDASESFLEDAMTRENLVKISGN